MNVQLKLQYPHFEDQTIRMRFKISQFYTAQVLVFRYYEITINKKLKTGQQK